MVLVVYPSPILYRIFTGKVNRGEKRWIKSNTQHGTSTRRSEESRAGCRGEEEESYGRYLRSRTLSERCSAEYPQDNEVPSLQSMGPTAMNGISQTALYPRSKITAT